MRKTFEIGPGLSCDADRLVASRLLVQANSGGGKTRTLRRLLEQSHGRLQHLVIDPEGEYHTLREHFDYVLAAPSGGDTVAHPRTAAMLAERLLQLNVSAILDIYELNPDQRVLFVQRFLDALVNAPRELWHPTLIVLDEAHVYAPEGKENASTSAVKAMASRGRKRGFCLVPATQRLAKLSKDVAAECNNKLIGRCTLDVDIKRAAEELGFTTNEQKQGLRQLEPGQFYAYGPAFDVKAPVLVMVGSVKSHHPEPGQKAAPVPAPTEKVKKVLQQLADLPAEAEEREKSIKELRADVVAKDRRIKELERTAQLAPRGEKQEVKQVPALTDADRALIEKLTKQLAELENGLWGGAVQLSAEMQTSMEELIKRTWYQFEGIHQKARKDFSDTFDKSSVKKLLERLNGLVPPAQVRGSGIGVARPPAQVHAKSAPSRQAPGAKLHADGSGESIPPAKQKILNALAFFEGIGVPQADKTQLALIVGVSPTSGGYFNNLGGLRSSGLIEYPSGGTVMLSTAGRAIANSDGIPETTAQLQDAIKAKLPPAKWKVVEALIRFYPDSVTKDELAEVIEVSPTSGGYFNNLGSLRTLGLLDYPKPGHVQATPVLFLDGR